MPERVNLASFHCFSDNQRLARLNRHTKLNTELMPHEIAAATGCELKAAMQLLVLLYSLYLAEGFLLVYHNEHVGVPIAVRQFSEGFPAVPFSCSLCERIITSRDAISYDFLFKLRANIEFTVESDDIY